MYAVHNPFMEPSMLRIFLYIFLGYTSFNQRGGSFISKYDHI